MILPRLLPCALALALAWPLVAAARPLPLDEALSLAERTRPAMETGRLQIERNEHLLKSTLAGFGPRVVGTASFIHWDRALTFQSEVLNTTTGQTETVENVTRAQNSWGVGLQVQQPLTPLFGVYLASRLASLDVDRAQLDLERQTRVLREQVVQAYYPAIALRQNLTHLDSMHASVSAHLSQVQEFLNLAPLNRDDLLRVQVQLASVERERAAAQAAWTVAQATLALLVGEPLGSAYDLEPGPLPAPLDVSPEACEQEALGQRRDLEAARTAIEAARLARNQRYLDWVPQIDSVFAYSWSSDTIFESPDQWYIGVGLAWPLWEWGRSWHALKAAEVERRQAEQALRELEDAVRLEVRSAWVNANRAYGDIARAETAVAQALENLEIQNIRAREKLNTTTDVLDAQSDVMTAQRDRVLAEAQYRTARFQLETAMGR